MCVKLVCSKEANDGGAVHIKYRNNQTLWKMCHASFQMVTIPITYNILFPGGGGWRGGASWRRRRGSPPPGTRSSPSGSSMGSWYSAACRVFSLDFKSSSQGDVFSGGNCEAPRGRQCLSLDPHLPCPCLPIHYCCGILCHSLCLCHCHTET